MSFIELRGDQVTKVPQTPGLYAWYFRPALHNRDVVLQTLARLMSAEPRIVTEVEQRYGMRFVMSGSGQPVFSSDRQTVTETVNTAFSEAEVFLSSFFQSPQFAYFSRPIYIGIAKNLWERVYNQHYTNLIDLWDPESRVSKFLNGHPGAGVQVVMDSLDLPHSFALEARVAGIPPRDLMVSVLQTDQMPESIGADTEKAEESSTRRALERMLQLLSDPVCGRR